MAAEFFDDKLVSLGYIYSQVVSSRNLTFDEIVFLEFATSIASFDASIAIWKEKYRWDAVRPFTAISYLYGDQQITAYGGPGMIKSCLYML